MIVVLAACGRPPLRVIQHGTSITIDMQTLGEYPTDVARLRLIDASANCVLWDIKGCNDPQLGTIVLTVGTNDANVKDVRHGSYDVITPRNAKTFEIRPGTRYIVEAWRYPLRFSKANAGFMTAK
jgi:hypothetical protein